MPCGRLSGFAVLDFDPPEGVKLFERMYDGNELPPTAMTPRGGYHTLHAFDERIAVPNEVKIAPGLDIRSEGGYIVVPSAFQDGRVWIATPDKPAPPLPLWVLRLLGKRQAGSLAPPAENASDGLPAGVKQGQRNQAATRLAGRYLAKGLSVAETLAILRAWNRRNEPPLPDGELRSVVESIAKKEGRKGPVIELVDSSDLSRLEGPSEQKIVDPFIPRSSKTILAGLAGSYKTTLALNLAVCVRNGLPLFGRFSCAQGRVLYLDRENSAQLTKFRIDKISRGVRGLQGGIVFQFPKERPNLADPRVREAYIRIIEQQKIDLVIFDSFLCFVNLRNENDNTEVRNLLEQVSEIPARTGAAILFIDHAAKASPDKLKAGIRVTPRGASAKADWADVVITIEEREDEARKLRLIRFPKTRYNLPMPPLLVEVGPNLVFVPSGLEEVCPPFTVRQVVEDHPGICGNELYAELTKLTGCSRRTAISATNRTVTLGFIRRVVSGRVTNYHPVGAKVQSDDCTYNGEEQEAEEQKSLVCQ